MTVPSGQGHPVQQALKQVFEVHEARGRGTMELHQVRYFVALARTLHFTRAADQCSITQPALTKAVKRLEQELGGTLLHRERQLTQLTDLGKLVLPMLERTLAAADSVRVHAQEFQRKAIAPLRIGLAPCISAALIAPALADIARFIPGLQVELVEHEGTTMASALLEGMFNAAFTGGEVAALPDRIDHWSLFDEPFVLLCGHDSEFASMAAVPTDALKKARWLELVGCEPVQRFWEGIAAEPGGVQVAHRGRNVTHLQHMVEAGLGVLLVPSHMPRLPSLAARPIVGQPLRRTVSLFVVAGRHYTPALQALVRIARVRSWNGEAVHADNEIRGSVGTPGSPEPQDQASFLGTSAMARAASTTGPTSTSRV